MEAWNITEYHYCFSLRIFAPTRAYHVIKKIIVLIWIRAKLFKQMDLLNNYQNVYVLEGGYYAYKEYNNAPYTAMAAGMFQKENEEGQKLYKGFVVFN